MNWIQKIEQAMSKKKFHWILLLGCMGVAIMILSSFLHPNEEDAQSTGEVSTADEQESSQDKIGTGTFEKQYETELSTVLDEIVGVSEVSVVVNVDSTEEKVVHYDVHKSTQSTNESAEKGGNRTITQEKDDRKTAIYRDENGETPLIVKKMKPKVRGVLVVAKGVENLEVKALITEAVQRVLDVPAHRISVLPKG